MTCRLIKGVQVVLPVVRHRGLVFAASIVLMGLTGCGAFDDGLRPIRKLALPSTFHNDGEAKELDGVLPPPTDASQIEDTSGAAPPTDDVVIPEQKKGPLLLAPESQWWTAFQSDELSKLVTQAFSGNQDLRSAIARVAQAEEQAVIAGAAQYPNVTGNFTFSGEEPLGGPGLGGTGINYGRVPQFSLKVSYELDLWGKNAFAAESAYAQALSSFHAREVVALTMASDIVSTYIDFLAETDHIKVAESNLVNARNSLRSVQTRLEQGDATQVEVLQQETTTANAEATVQVRKLNREKAINKLAALLGTTPGSLHLVGVTLDSMRMPVLEVGTPSQLLCRRPDIRRAEAAMLAADADIKVARAAMLPDLTLSLERGQSAYNFSSLLMPESRFLTAVGTVTQSIFDADKNLSTIRQNKAKHEELVHTYHQTILEAVHDVEDAMSALRYTGEQSRALVKATAYAQRAYDVSTFAFDKHAIDFLSLLESQRSLYTTHDAEVSARADLMKASVSLFKALGGGLDDPHC